MPWRKLKFVYIEILLPHFCSNFYLLMVWLKLFFLEIKQNVEPVIQAFTRGKLEFIDNQYQCANSKQVVYFPTMLSYSCICIYGIMLFLMIIICLLYLWKFICLFNYFTYVKNKMYMRYIICIFIHCQHYNKRYVNHTIRWYFSLLLL